MLASSRQTSGWRGGAVLTTAAFGLCVLFSFSSRAQSIFTVAGGGPLGDGKPATAAIFVEPSRIAFDRAGNLLISDVGHRLVRRVGVVSGLAETVAGGGTSGLGDDGPALLAELKESSGIVVDGDGNLYIGDQDRVRRVDARTGIITTYAGGGDGDGDNIPATTARLDSSLAGLAFDAAGNLHLTMRASVRKVDRATGIIATVAGIGEPGFSGDGGPATLARLDSPAGLAFDAAGSLYISDGTGHGGNNRIRRVDVATKIITTFAGNGTPCCTAPEGDGGPATEAGVWNPTGMAFDSAGNMYLTHCCSKVRRIDAKSGIITTIAGEGGPGFSGDGGPALSAMIEFPSDVKFDRLGRLAVADRGSDRIRLIDLGTGIITTFAGGGPNGDGAAATAGQLYRPGSVSADGTGGLYIADTGGERVRHVNLSDGVIRTLAGTGDPIHAGDGGPATQASLITPAALEIDGKGSVFVGERFGWIRRIDLATGQITTIAGNGSNLSSGDGGPATEAGLGNVLGIAIDAAGNIVFSEQPGDDVTPVETRVRRIDAETGIVTTVAGIGEMGFSGDGGLATQARLSTALGVAFDSAGSVYVADSDNHRVRRIDAVTRIISTVAGGGTTAPQDGVKATEADIFLPTDVHLDERDDLYIIGFFGGVLKVDRNSGILTAIAGPNDRGFVGDGGPARDASFFSAHGIDVDASGNIFVADSSNNRIRAIFACRDIASAALESPGDGAIDVSSAPTLTWRPTPGAFRYDVFLAKEGDTGRYVATDLTATSFTPQNLELGKTYFWRVRAKGDPFCEPQRESLSAIRGFITIPPCEPPLAPSLAAPTDGATVADFTATLAWNSVPRASSYDVLLGATLPPPVLVRGTPNTTFTTPRLATGTTYYWSVVAHASCDGALTSPSPIRSFFLAGPCNPAGQFELRTPENGAFNVPTTTTLSWSASENATSYDLFLGTTDPPPIFLPSMRETSVRIAGLDPDRTYFWRVKAAIACDDAKSMTSTLNRFTTEDTCEKPGGTTIVFTPPGAVGVGQTYAIAWRDAPGLDPGGTYVVERSLQPSFTTILDSQETTTTTATFIAESPGMHYHRVRPITRCNRAITGPDSAASAVNVVEGSPGIIFTLEPEAVISRVGQNLEDLKATFAIENISSKPVSVILGRAEIESVPFFRIIDPLGGDSVFVTLEPRVPKRFELRYSGPPNDQAGAYQGLVVATAAGSPIIPYAFVNLKVGDRALAAPQFRVGGAPAEYAFFPGLDGGDGDRAPVTIEIRNPGTSPMELGAEIGPEVWLEPEPGWNSSAIPAGGVRAVKLFTRRNRALNGSALPRYTFFGVRTRTGESARLLVQDNPAPPVAQARTTALDPGVRTLIVPDVISESTGSGSVLVTRLRLTNVGSETVQAELIHTPSGTDGFSSSVRRATIVVPPNDVATLTDPLLQVFGATRPAVGQVEVRVAGGESGLLGVESSIVPGDRADASFVRIPTLRRGDGARAGLPHQISGITAGASSRTSLVLAETSGTGDASVRLELHDSTGSLLGQTLRSVPRYGHMRIDDVVGTLGGGTALPAGRLTITVTEGGGTVAALAKIGDTSGEHVSVLQASPVGGSIDAKLLLGNARRHSPREGVTATLAAPFVVSGPISASGGPDVATLMGFSAPFGIPIDFHVIFTSASGTTLQQLVTVLGGSIVEFKNILQDLFGLSGAQSGSIVIESDPRGHVYARLVAGNVPAGSISFAAPVSEIVTRVETARPLAIDGVEQSVDPNRGSRWSLYLRELGGESGTLMVRLYEAGNRTHAIAEKEFALSPNGRLALETIFDAMDLNTESRRKNRTNVLCVVTPRSGRALFTAVAVEIDNRTGVPTTHPLQPSSGTPSTGTTPSLAQVIPAGAQRPRPVRRP